MKHYHVTMTATANVSTSVDVVAETEELARIASRAKADEGDVIWEYDGAIDGTIETEECIERLE